MIKFGITEQGDPAYDFSWVNKLCDGNIIISKHYENKKLQQAVLDNKGKCILHITCTGYGGTSVEPNVEKPEIIHKAVLDLIKAGFPVEQIVLRTDPIIPTLKGIERVKSVWDLFLDTGIKRVRYSVLDMYPHVKQRFMNEIGKIPFGTFKAPDKMFFELRNAVVEYSDRYSFEACAENLPVQTGCISKKDFDILGIKYENEIGGFQRKGCMCVAGKTELLSCKHRCPSKCVYCYWKD